MSFYDYEVTAQDGSKVSLDAYRGKVCLVVNTATGCGFTPQYEDLERLYSAYRAQGFEILDFPCNQFKAQAPGSDEQINQFCTLKYNTDFPRFKKVEVNGPNAEPLFKDMSAQLPFEGFGKGLKAKAVSAASALNNKQFGDAAYIGWNFTKFLLDRDGNLVARFEPTVSMDEVEAAVKTWLNASFNRNKSELTPNLGQNMIPT